MDLLRLASACVSMVCASSCFSPRSLRMDDSTMYDAASLTPAALASCMASSIRSKSSL